MDKQTFGTFVAEQRKRQGLTQRQLAQLLHVTDKAVSKWERGLSYPDVTLLQPLAAALCLDTDRLLTCRREESEEHMTQITPPLPRAEASPAVQAVLDISDANSRQRRKRQRLMAAAALAIAVIAVLAVMQYNGALFISRRTVTPEGITLSFYRDSLIGGRLRMAADAPLSIADAPCSFCGQSDTHDVTRLALDSRLTALDAPQWSADGQYLLLSGSTRSASAWLEVWAFPSDGADTGITRRDAAFDILLQLSGHQDEDASAAPLLPALPGVSAHSYLPCVLHIAQLVLDVGELLRHVVQHVDDGGNQLAFLAVGIQVQALGQTLQICYLLRDLHVRLLSVRSVGGQLTWCGRYTRRYGCQ